MHRIKLLLLIFLMLCGLSGVFVTTFIMVGTASAVSRSGPNPNPTCDSMGDCCSGEFCCWAQGQTPPTCASTSSQPGASTQPGKNQGKIDGERAGKNDPVGTNRKCPEAEGSEYCIAWEEAYAAAQAAKSQGISRNGIFTGVAITAAILAAAAAIAAAILAAAGQSGWFPIKGILRGVVAVAVIVAIGAAAAALFPPLGAAILTLL